VVSHLRTTGCHRSMVPHNFTCSRHKRAYTVLTPAGAGWYSIYLPRRDGRLSWPKYIVCESFRQPHPVHSPPDSTHLVHITSSQSLSSLLRHSLSLSFQTQNLSVPQIRFSIVYLLFYDCLWSNWTRIILTAYRFFVSVFFLYIYTGWAKLSDTTLHFWL